MSERNKIVYQDWAFVDKDIQSGSVYLAMSLMSDQLEANTFTATVNCTDKTIIDFERNAPLTYYNNGQQKGIFYVQSITRNGPTSYTISATSAIGLLIEGQHYGGIYTGQTVAEVLPSICGTVPYAVKTNLRDIALYGWLPVATPRDNLSQVLFAIGASIRTDLDGVLHIETLWDGIINDLGKDRMYQGAAVNYSAKVTQVIVTEHQYVEGTEEAQLFEGTASQNDVITFDEPMHDLVASGFSILESGANYAKVSSGSGTLTGKKYIHNTREVVRDVSQANEPNIKTVTEATLVSLVNSVGVAERLANYYQWTETIESGVIYQGELPGNRANTWNPYDSEAVTACLESADITLSNTLKAEETMLVGFVPPKRNQIITYDHRELLTGSGTWVVPEGVKEITYVLIGGGQGGSGGTNGGAGGRGKFGTSTSGTAGTGGAAGGAGIGGKVYLGSMNVSAHVELTYSCGVGGDGGAGGDSPSDGNFGGDTTLGMATSADGSTSTVGYTDAVTGDTYATPGVDGVAGGDGTGGNGNASASGTEVTLIYKGVTYTSGARGTYWYDTDINKTYRAYSGWGGGPAAGANGGDGGNGHVTSQPYASGGDGGPGGAAVAGDSATNYGCGGNGGNGGGGGGGGGSCTGAEDRYTWEGAGGSGGAGSTGGAGAPGCIILYYGVQETVPSGPFVDKNNKTFLDKFGRLIVV